jgi:hypothetical protein
LLADDPDIMEIKAICQAEFTIPVYGEVFNVFELVASTGGVNRKRVERGMHLPTHFQVMEFLKALFIPFVSLYQILSAAYPKNNKTTIFNATVYGLLFITWVALYAVYGKYTSLLGWAWTIMLASIRNGFRERYNLRSNVLGDFIASCFLWPQVLT